jgi:ubiquinone/menaquinone biosynthesis C-methylase UbiE
MDKSLHDWASNYYHNSEDYATRLKSKWSAEWLDTFSLYIDTIHQFTNHDSIVLDVGCGGGQTTYLMAEKVKKVIGVDLSLNALQDRPPQPVNVSFQEENALNLSFADNTFDAVTSYAMIEHLPDVEAAFKEAVRVLKPGGYLIIFAPNMISPVRLISLTLKGYRANKWNPDAYPRFWFQALRLNFLKLLRLHHEFVYRQPLVNDLSFPGSDWDAICLVNPFDLLRLCRQSHLKVHRIAQGTTPIGRLTARWIPLFSHGIGLVAQKNDQHE